MIMRGLKQKKGRFTIVTMTKAAYKDYLQLDGIKTKHDLIDYINQTWGLMGTVVDIRFDG